MSEPGTRNSMRVDFGEPQVLLSKKERLEIFRTERSLGLDNTVAFCMRENPDLTFEQAKALVLDNIEIETWRVGAMKALMAIGGGVDTTLDDTSQRDPNAPQAVPDAPGQPVDSAAARGGSMVAVAA